MSKPDEGELSYDNLLEVSLPLSSSSISLQFIIFIIFLRLVRTRSREAARRA